MCKEMIQLYEGGIKIIDQKIKELQNEIKMLNSEKEGFKNALQNIFDTQQGNLFEDENND